ncbi:(2Fe-2S)-binding protein [Nesterenkonia suensis]
MTGPETRPETGPGSPTVTVTVDGAPRRVPAGRSVAAALMLTSEQPSWRVTRHDGSPRGLFCGIGSCFDCLVTVDGTPNQRACLVPVAEGMSLTTRPGASDE